MAKILVWSDCLDAGILIKRILGIRKHDIGVFIKEREAIAHLRSNGVDMTILDINYRTTPGINRLKRLLQADARIPVIVFSACPTISSEEAFLRMGAYTFLVKPMENVTLVDKIDRFTSIMSAFKYI